MTNIDFVSQDIRKNNLCDVSVKSMSLYGGARWQQMHELLLLVSVQITVCWVVIDVSGFRVMREG